ncbi:hypothetical protein EDB89DRAFT_1858200, partial [Lactarius sanguifluus]
AIPSSKTALLTASQKKVNHIQSERAITHCGCEALCGTMPAAICAGEEASSGLGPGGKKLRARGQVSEDGEKMAVLVCVTSTTLSLQRLESIQ